MATSRIGIGPASSAARLGLSDSWDHSISVISVADVSLSRTLCAASWQRATLSHNWCIYHSDESTETSDDLTRADVQKELVAAIKCGKQIQLDVKVTSLRSSRLCSAQ